MIPYKLKCINISSAGEQLRRIHIGLPQQEKIIPVDVPCSLLCNEDNSTPFKEESVRGLVKVLAHKKEFR